MAEHLDLCSQCENCCKVPEVSMFIAVDLDDARRIKKATKLEYSTFLDFSKLNPEDVQELKDDVEKGFKDEPTETVFRLKMLIDDRILRFKIVNGNCFFLDNNNQCKIHKIAPGICKLFPFWYKKHLNNKIELILHESAESCRLLNRTSLENISEEKRAELIEIAKRVDEGVEEYLRDVEQFVKENNICD